MHDADVIAALDQSQIERMIVIAVSITVMNLETISETLAKPLLGALRVSLQPSSMVTLKRRAADFPHAYHHTTFAAPSGDAFASARRLRI